MNALLFVLLFVVLGLGTFFIALSGGRGGLNAALHSQSRGGRKSATFALFVSLAVLGVALPAAVIAAVKNGSSDPAGALRNMTSGEKRGQKLFGERCAACHTLKASNAVAQVGPNLDDLAPNAALVLATIKSGQSRGAGQMPANIYSGQDAQDVADYVALAVGQKKQSGSG
jgi:mono/diheme cytochrome c family protein